MNRTPTRDYVAWLLRDAGMIELCHMNPGPVREWFTDADAALAWARKRASTGNLFTTLNEISWPRLNEYALRQEEEDLRRVYRTPDEAIPRRVRLFFDFDPERPKGTASSEAELAEANERMKACRELLEFGHDWPAPAIAMSGNGWHLHYRTHLLVNDTFNAALAVIYDELHHRLSDDLVSFDRSVKNPARLCALYGSRKRKGAATAERPHRHSWVEVPDHRRMVKPSQVLRLAEHWQREVDQRALNARHASARTVSAIRTISRKGRGDYASLDVVNWFKSHDHYQGHAKSNIHRVLCPWHEEHTTSPETGAIVFEADGGWPGFKCHHAHCAGRDIRSVIDRWADADQFCAAEFQPRRVA